MRFVTFKNSQNKPEIGIHTGPFKKGFITPLRSILEKLAPKQVIPFSMIDLIEQEDLILPIIREFLAKIEKTPSALTSFTPLPEESLTLLSPIPTPRSMRDGYAFRQHVESARRGRGVPMIPEFDLFPVFYFTNHLAVTGPGPVRVQKLAQERLDFELEAAIVIGKSGQNIPASQADQHIFGYTIMNDWSARALQTEEMKMSLGPAKGKDFATSLGPYLLTPDELSHAEVSSPQGKRHKLRMQAFLNNRQVSEGNLADMTWTFAQIIERASYGVRLRAGEVIGSGTVGTGCFMELNVTGVTQNLWIKPGDHVRLEIEGLGTLENTIVEGSESYEK